MKINFLATTFIALLFSTPTMSQTVTGKAKAPSISLNGWIGQKPSSVEGKTIILEFWATWCGGCIEAIPHINEMVDKYSGNGVVFISINSFDKLDKIEKFLQKTEMKTYLAMDNEKATYNAYEVGSMPRTYIIDKNGFLRWKGVPGLLTEDFMAAFLKEDSIITSEIGNPLLYSLNISLTKDRSISNISMTDAEKYGFNWRNRGITDVVAQCYNSLGLNRYEYRFEGKIPLEPALDVELRADSSISAAYIYNDLIQKMASMFGFSIVPVKEEVEICTLLYTFMRKQQFPRIMVAFCQDFKQKAHQIGQNMHRILQVVKTKPEQRDGPRLFVPVVFQGNGLDAFFNHAIKQ